MADWSMGDSERQRHAKMFAAMQPSNGRLSGAQARQCFLGSQLPQDKLGQIWALVDRDADGFITEAEFVAAMGLINGAMQGKPLPPSLPQSLLQSGPSNTSLLSNLTSSHKQGPSYENLSNLGLDSSPSHQQQPPPQQQHQQQQQRAPAPLAPSASKPASSLSGFGFDNLVDMSSLSRSATVHASKFASAPISRGAAPVANYNAMPAQGGYNAMPAQSGYNAMPSSQQGFTSMGSQGIMGGVGGGGLGGGFGGVAQPSQGFGQQQLLAPQQSQLPAPAGFGLGPSLGTGLPSAAVGAPLTGAWEIPKNDRAKYNLKFNQMDKQHLGFLSGTRAKEILVSTHVPYQLLGQIWQLADVDRDGNLTNEEFAIAMHLCTQVNAGRQLPTTLPTELLPRAARMAMERQQQQAAEQQAQQQQQLQAQQQAQQQQAQQQQAQLLAQQAQQVQQNHQPSSGGSLLDFGGASGGSSSLLQPQKPSGVSATTGSLLDFGLGNTSTSSFGLGQQQQQQQHSQPSSAPSQFSLGPSQTQQRMDLPQHQQQQQNSQFGLSSQSSFGLGGQSQPSSFGLGGQSNFGLDGSAHTMSFGLGTGAGAGNQNQSSFALSQQSSFGIGQQQAASSFGLGSQPQAQSNFGLSPQQNNQFGQAQTQAQPQSNFGLSPQQNNQFGQAQTQAQLQSNFGLSPQQNSQFGSFGGLPQQQQQHDFGLSFAPAPQPVAPPRHIPAGAVATALVPQAQQSQSQSGQQSTQLQQQQAHPAAPALDLEDRLRENFRQGQEELERRRRQAEEEERRQIEEAERVRQQREQERLARIEAARQEEERQRRRIMELEMQRQQEELRRRQEEEQRLLVERWNNFFTTACGRLQNELLDYNSKVAQYKANLADMINQDKRLQERIVDLQDEIGSVRDVRDSFRAATREGARNLERLQSAEQTAMSRLMAQQDELNRTQQERNRYQQQLAMSKLNPNRPSVAVNHETEKLMADVAQARIRTADLRQYTQADQAHCENDRRRVLAAQKQLELTRMQVAQLRQKLRAAEQEVDQRKREIALQAQREEEIRRRASAAREKQRIEQERRREEERQRAEQARRAQELEAIRQQEREREEKLRREEEERERERKERLEAAKALAEATRAAQTEKQTAEASETKANDICVALYAYTAKNPDELSFEQGDRIEILAREGDWWEGVLNSVRGVFPCNFVEIYDPLADAAREEEARAIAAAAEARRLADEAEQAEALRRAEAQAAREKAEHERQEREREEQARRHELEVAAATTAAAVANAVQPPAKPKKSAQPVQEDIPFAALPPFASNPNAHVVSFEFFAPDDPEALHLRLGDVVILDERQAEGWCLGHTLDGRSGVFPETYISLYSDKHRTHTAVYDYVPVNEGDLPLTEGMGVILLEVRDEGWWDGVADGRRGLFPGNRVVPAEPAEDVPPPVPMAPTAAEVSPPPKPKKQAVASAPASPASTVPAGSVGRVLTAYTDENNVELKPNTMVQLTNTEGDMWEGIIAVRGKGKLTVRFPSHVVQVQEKTESKAGAAGAAPAKPAKAAEPAAVPAPAFVANFPPPPKPAKAQEPVAAAPPAFTANFPPPPKPGKPVEPVITAAIAAPVKPAKAVEPATPVSSEPQVGKVVQPYTAGDVELKVGMLVQVTSAHGALWEGTVTVRGKGKISVQFPSHVVHIVEKAAGNNVTAQRALKVESIASSSDMSSPSIGSPSIGVPTPAPVSMVLVAETRYRTLYDYTATNQDELSFTAGSLILLIDKVEEEWWRGECNGQQGLFPVNYVDVNDPQVTQREVPTNPFSSSSDSVDLSSWQRTIPEDMLARLSKEEIKRQELIHELLTTERAYVADLQMVMDVFYYPLEKKAILTKEEIKIMFINWAELLQVNSAFLQDLEALKQQCGPIVSNIGPVLCKHFSNMDSYVEFCCGQREALVSLGEKNTVVFNKFVKQCQRDPRTAQLPLSAYLLKPMQRITKYPLLLRKMLHHTASNHADNQATADATRLSEELADRVNEGVRRKESMENLARIQSRFHTDPAIPFDFTSDTSELGPRYFLYEGVFYKQKSGKELYAFLCNDVLVLTKRTRDTTTLGLVKKDAGYQYTLYKKPLLLNTLKFVSDPEGLKSPNSSAFQLISAQIETKFNLMCESYQEKLKWGKKVTDASQKYNDTLHRKAHERKRVVAMGTLSVVIVSAHNLPKHNDDKVVNPYCVVEVGGQREQSHAHHNTVNPVWNAERVLSVQSIEEKLRVSIFSEDTYQSDDFLGDVTISLDDFPPGGVKKVTTDLQNTDSGTVTLELELRMAKN